MFTKGFVLWIRIKNHQSESNRTAKMVIHKIPISALSKAIFSTPEIWGNILNIFEVGLEPPKSCTKNQ